MKFTKINIRVPDLNVSYGIKEKNFSLPSVRAQNIAVLRAIINTDSVYIEKWGEVFELDPEITASFIAAESGGRNLAANRFGAVGKMQMTANALAESVPKWKVYQSQPMPSAAVNYMNSVLPFIMTLKRDMGLTSSQKSQLQNLLQSNPEFNIMAGCMYLRWLLEKFNGQLNKVMIGYNAGPYNEIINNSKLPVSTLSLLNEKDLSSESRSYLLKLLGVSGYLDLMFTEKLM